MKLYYIANARMPTEKAHGIQIAKMCEAFIEAGIDLTLVVPNRKTVPKSMKDYYGLRVDIPMIKVPAIHTHTGGKILFTLSSLSFALSYFVHRWLFWKKGEDSVVYTIDIDNTAYCLVPFLGLPYFSEAHTAKAKTWIHRILFSRISGLITINGIIKKEMIERFGLATQKVYVEPNGVDEQFFPSAQDSDVRNEARRLLGIDENINLALYTGRFFEWKGLEIFPAASLLLEDTMAIGIVGGPKEEFTRITGIQSLPSNLLFFGEQPHSKIPLWLQAADVLVVLGTKRDMQSYYYTSPMKLFEYLASGKPIVASDTPAIREIISEKEGVLYTPDSPDDMAKKLCYAAYYSDEIASKVAAAKARAMTFLWRNRARRIISAINETLHRHTGL